MNAALLLRALKKFLEEQLSDYAASQNAKGEWVKPRVFDWALPFKNPKEGQDIDFPYVVVAIEEGEDPIVEADYTTLSTIKVFIAFGVYNESPKVDGETHPDGFYDLLNLMETVRIALLKEGVIDRKYRIEKPYKWKIPKEQPYPLWVGEATSIWTVAAIEEMPEEVDIHGINFDYGN